MIVTVSPASITFGSPADEASATIDFTNSMIASVEIVSVSVLVDWMVPSNCDTDRTVIVSDPVAVDGTVASITTPNCSPGARVGVSVSTVALSATPSISASG